ncbi:hypothetical protein OEZ86_012462 [Tetradesmus obliquus]|nr:hypothetical protein OEZ86_012462 [Tetradesmus obliquus]
MAQPLSQSSRLGSFKLDLDDVVFSTDDEASPELLVPQQVQAAAAAAGYSEAIPGGRQHQVKHAPSGSYTAPPAGKRSKLDAHLASSAADTADAADAAGGSDASALKDAGVTAACEVHGDDIKSMEFFCRIIQG